MLKGEMRQNCKKSATHEGNSMRRERSHYLRKAKLENSEEFYFGAMRPTGFFVPEVDAFDGTTMPGKSTDAGCTSGRDDGPDRELFLRADSEAIDDAIEAHVTEAYAKSDGAEGASFRREASERRCRLHITEHGQVRRAMRMALAIAVRRNPKIERRHANMFHPEVRFTPLPLRRANALCRQAAMKLHERTGAMSFAAALNGPSGKLRWEEPQSAALPPSARREQRVSGVESASGQTVDAAGRAA